MKKEYTLEYLAGLRFCKLWFALEPDDDRWTELVAFKGWSSEFQQWLEENGLECIPQHAKKFLSRKDKELHAVQDWLEIVKNKAEGDDTLHRTDFYNLLEKRLKEHKDKPYDGRLSIGHFMGIRKTVTDNPYDYKDHVIGQIEDYAKGPDGRITVYILSTPDNTAMTVPAEMTYRIY